MGRSVTSPRAHSFDDHFALPAASTSESDSLSSLSQLLLCSLGVAGHCVQVFVAEPLRQPHEIVSVVSKELVGHRVAQEMTMQLDAGDGSGCRSFAGFLYLAVQDCFYFEFLPSVLHARSSIQFLVQVGNPLGQFSGFVLGSANLLEKLQSL